MGQVRWMAASAVVGACVALLVQGLGGPRDTGTNERMAALEAEVAALTRAQAEAAATNVRRAGGEPPRTRADAPPLPAPQVELRAKASALRERIEERKAASAVAQAIGAGLELSEVDREELESRVRVALSELASDLEDLERGRITPEEVATRLTRVTTRLADSLDTLDATTRGRLLATVHRQSHDYPWLPALPYPPSAKRGE